MFRPATVVPPAATRKSALLVLLALACIAPSAIAEDETEATLETKIISATVYGRQAQIVRRGEVTISEGSTSITCSDLPEKFVESSLDIEASGLTGARIIGIDLRRPEPQEADSREHQELIDELNMLQARRDSVSNVGNAVRRRVQLTDSVSDLSAERGREQLIDGTFSPTQWKELLAFFERERLGTSEREQEIRRVISGIDKRVGWVSEEIRLKQLGNVGKQVVIDCGSATPGKLTVEISYLVPDASWNPEYTLRYEEESKQVELTYSALIGQATGEDWDDVNVVLSTAAPQFGAALPELAPKHLGLVSGALTGRVTDASTGRPIGYANVTLQGTPYGGMSDADGVYVIPEIPLGVYSVTASFVGYERGRRTPVRVEAGRVGRADFALRQEPLSAEEVVMEASRPIVRPINTVQEAIATQPGVVLREGETHIKGGRPSTTPEPELPPLVPHVEAQVSGSQFAANLEIPKPVTLGTGDEPRRALVVIEDLPGEFVLHAVPRLSDRVFVRGTITNPLDFPILPGVAEVYVETATGKTSSGVTNFVGESKLDAVASGEEFTMYLGADQNLKVERTTEKHVLSKARDKTMKVRYGYSIIAKSFKKHADELWVTDRIPVSSLKEVKVDDVEITPAPDEKTEDGLLTWKLDIAPGQELQIHVSYVIEYPSRMSPQDLGLEE